MLLPDEASNTFVNIKTTFDLKCVYSYKTALENYTVQELGKNKTCFYCKD